MRRSRQNHKSGLFSQKRQAHGSLSILLPLPILLSISMIAMFGADIGHMVLVRSELQNAADAAAIAGVMDFKDKSSWTMSDFDALQVAGQNTADGRGVSQTSPRTIVTASSETPGSGTPGTCTVEASMEIDNIFAKLICRPSETITASSTAYMGYATNSPTGSLFPVAGNINSFMVNGESIQPGAPITLQISPDGNVNNSHFTVFKQKSGTQLQIQMQSQVQGNSGPPAANQVQNQAQLQGPVTTGGSIKQIQGQSQVQMPTNGPATSLQVQNQLQIQAEFKDTATARSMMQYQFQGAGAGTPSPSTAINDLVAFTSDGDPALASYLQQNIKPGTQLTIPVFSNYSVSANGVSATIAGYATITVQSVGVQRWSSGNLSDVSIQGTLSGPAVWTGAPNTFPSLSIPDTQLNTVKQNTPIACGLSK